MKQLLKKTGLFFIVLGLGIIGAILTQAAEPSRYPYTRVAIIHDYMIENAIDLCKDHNGMHYIVHESKILAEKTKGYDKDYPCEERTLIRCNDGSLQQFETGITHCFIDESQLDDTLKNKDVTNEYR